MRARKVWAAARGLSMWVLCLAVLRPALAIDPHRSLAHYGHQVWQTDNGLPQNTVHSILQTRDGFLWLGTEGGLVRFDGVNLQVFDTAETPEMKSNAVYDLLEDAVSGLWISTGDGLLRYRDGGFRRFGVQDGLPGETVWFTHQDHNGGLWAVTSQGIAVLRGDRFQAVPGVGNLSTMTRRALAEGRDGMLWLGTGSGLVGIDAGSPMPTASRRALPGVEVAAVQVDQAGRLWIGMHDGLASYAQGKLSAVPLPALLGRVEVTALLPDQDGGMWVGTSNGVAHVVNGAITVLRMQDGLPGKRVTQLYIDREGALWISTEGGAARFAGGRLQALPAQSGVAGGLVLSYFEDREGDLWLGTDSGGLAVLRDQKFTTLTTADGLSGDVIRAVLQDAKGTTWIGTSGAGLDRRNPDQRNARGGQREFTTLRTGEGLASNVILSLAASRDGVLWVGTPDGLTRYEYGEMRVYRAANGLADDIVRSLYVDGKTLWAGTPHGLSNLTDGKFTSYSKMDGLGSDFVGAIQRAQNGDLWIGTTGGLTRMRNGAFTNFTIKSGLSSDVITAIHEDAQGTLWLGTNDGGLNRLRNGRFQSFPSGANALPETIYAILEDGSGNLWLSSRTGIYRVAKSELEAYASGSQKTIRVTSYGTADGMRIRECSGGGHPAAWRMANGDLWFATLKGVSAIDPEHVAENRVPPLVAIETVLVDDRARPADTDLTIGPGTSRLEFRYAGLSFVAPQRVRYRYKLEGFDRDWIDAGTLRSAFYTNLSPGKYRFRVLAANNDGVWNEAGAAMDLRLEPHFYQTLWFYALLLVLTALLGYQLYRRRVRQVESEFSAVMAERGRIAREIHDTLAQGIVGISVQLEVVSRLLATSTEAAREQLDQTRELVRTSLTEARTSIWDLRSQGTRLEDLPAMISRSLSKIAAAAPAKVYFQVKGTYRPVARKVEGELVRIAQEAVTNAVRHAEAQRIDVELLYDAKRVCLYVQDDGQGFAGDTIAPQGHFGIKGMRERAAAINARLTIDSKPGEGTRVRLELQIA